MKTNKGYTLIELSIVLVVLGIVIVLIWRALGFNADHALAESERVMMRSADQAISGFVFAHSRLPCPDVNGDGIEDCAATGAVGTLPAISIGLSQADARRIRYGVYRNPALPPTGDADLAANVDRMPMLVTHGSPLYGSFELQGNRNALDLCAALRTASAKSPDDAFVHVVTAEGSINVAYALALAGRHDADNSGGLLDGANALPGTAFEAPARATDGGYDDRVVAVGFDRLIGRLGCSETLAAATHAHANAAVMAEITHQAMLDYKIQLDLINTLAEANVWAARAAIAIAGAGLLSASAEIAEGLAESLLTLGAAAAVEALAIAAEIAATIAVALAVGEDIVAEDVKAGAQGNVNAFASQGFVNRSKDLAESIRANANAADAAGVY